MISDFPYSYTIRISTIHRLVSVSMVSKRLRKGCFHYSIWSINQRGTFGPKIKLVVKQCDSIAVLESCPEFLHFSLRIPSKSSRLASFLQS